MTPPETARMGTTPPPSVVVREDGPDAVFPLPRGLARYVAWFGLAWVVGAVAFHFTIAPRLPAPFAGPADFVVTTFLAVVGLLFVWLGSTREEVRIGGGRVAWYQRVGPIRYRAQSVACADVRRFVVVRANEETGGAGAAYGPVWSVLFVEDVSGKRRRVGLWYRRELLLAVAAGLAARCGDSPPEVVDDPEDRLHPTQSAASRLVLTRRPDGLTIAIPPLGRSCLDRYFWGSLLMAFLVGMLVLIGIGTLRGQIPWEPEPPPVWVLAGGFIGCGGLVGLIAVANVVLRLAAAYGRTEVRVGPEGLSIDEGGFTGTLRMNWPRERIADIRVEVIPKYNAKCVQVIEPDGTRTDVLDRLTVDDIKWVAARLREALGK